MWMVDIAAGRSEIKMKNSIQFINHASVKISNGIVNLLCDPWYQGSAFNDGWDLISEFSDEKIIEILDGVTHIWLSHEHPDHFSVLFFKKFKKLIHQQSIQILFQKTSDQRVVNFLTANGFHVTELDFNEAFKVTDDFHITCIKDGFYDSGLLVESLGEKILNLNDCEVNSQQRANEVSRIVGAVDVLLTQFSYAAWKGGIDNKVWRENAAQEKLTSMKLQMETFKAKYCILMASYIYFSHEENFYLNDSINTPLDVMNEFKEFSCLISVLKPFEYFDSDMLIAKNKEGLQFWETEYSNLDQRVLHKSKPITFEQLENAFVDYCGRIHKVNNITLMKILSKVSPVKVFQPVIIELTDLSLTISIDYLAKEFKITNCLADISMSADSLHFLFNNSFGFDTLTVNGRLEESRSGGFVAVAKTLAIENLNNLGIFVELKTLFNFRIISLFLRRLYRVARKLEE